MKYGISVKYRYFLKDEVVLQWGGFNIQHLIRTSIKILKDPNSNRASKSRTMVKFSDSRQNFHEPRQHKSPDLIQKVAGPVEVMSYFQPQFNGSSLLGGD